MNTEIEILDLTSAETLTSTQLTFIKSILCGSTIAAAALASGVSRRTATTWMQPGHETRQAYERLKAQYRSSLFERLKRLQMQSLTALEASLSPEAPPAIRFSAAKFLYEQNFSELAIERTLPHDPDDCPQPRTMTDEEIRMEEIRDQERSLISIPYDTLSEEEVAHVEQTIERYRQSREARNAGVKSIEVDLRTLTVREQEEFRALDTEINILGLVRRGHMTEKEAELERKYIEKESKKRR